MHILNGSRWRNLYLDQFLANDSVRIKPFVWISVSKIDGLYFVPRKSFRLVINYISEIGVKNVFIKIFSRLNESIRNDKYLGFGYGLVLESKSEFFRKNDKVAFLAPCQPKCMERVVLPEELICFYNGAWVKRLGEDRVLVRDIRINKVHPIFSNQGWSEFSGLKLSAMFKKELTSLLDSIGSEIETAQFHELLHPNSVIREFSESLEDTKDNIINKKLNVHLFGYGQYTKTIIIPSIKKLVNIKRIHEIDSTQILIKNHKAIYDTSPMLRDGYPCDACFIASYHHTHARLAIDAVKMGIVAIIEKPIVTTQRDLRELLQVMRDYKGVVFSCFQKRYQIFNNYIYKDLGVSYNDPISFHCIVYEVPLPKFHWYTWPNSGSRLLSNGCHWVDYFLYLNAFCSVISYDLNIAKNGDIQIFLELENGAVFSMILTETGSGRLGLRDLIELRSGKSTIIIKDSKHYVSENDTQIIRRLKINRLDVYRHMYRLILHKIDQKMPGDSIETIERSSSLILTLEECYQTFSASRRRHLLQEV